MLPKIGINEKSAISETLARIAVSYASGKEVDVTQLKPVEEMNLDQLVEDYLNKRKLEFFIQPEILKIS